MPKSPCPRAVSARVRAPRRQKPKPRELLPEPIPAIPDEPALRALLGEHPAYRLLVAYLERFPVEAAVHLRQLVPTMREAMAGRLKAIGDQRAGPGLALTRMRVAPAGQRGRSSAPRPRSLVLAWVLMALENVAAAKNPAVRRMVEAILRGPRALAEEDLIGWSYVPRQVIELLDVRVGETKERRAQANTVRRLRQLQARELPKDEDLPALEPIDRRQEAHWWAQLGLDKVSSRATAQRFWLDVLRPLIDRLLKHTDCDSSPREGSWRRACVEASQLVNARYPDLWPDRPELLRKRYSYTPSSSPLRP